MSIEDIKKKLATVKSNDYVAVRCIPPVVLRDISLIAVEALDKLDAGAWRPYSEQREIRRLIRDALDNICKKLGIGS